MSAAPAPIPQTAIKTHAVLMPLSFFYLVIPKADKVCLGLIEEASRGFGLKSVHVPRSKFERVANVCYDTITDSLLRIKTQYIRATEAFDKHGVRADQYQSLLDNPPETTALGECSRCGRSVIDLKKGTAPTPHAYLTILPSRLTESQWTILGLIQIRTLAWEKDKELGAYRFFTEWRVVKSSELEQEAGLSTTAVACALRDLRELGLIETRERRGKPTLFRVCVDPMGNYATLPKLNPRVVSIKHNAGVRNRSTAEEKRKVEAAIILQPIDIEEETPTDQTVPLRLLGFCRNCRKFDLHRIIAMPAPGDLIPKSDFSHARAGPSPPKTSKMNINETTPETSKDIYASDFAKFLEAATDAGLPASEVDLAVARREWDQLDFNEKQAALMGLAARVEAGEYSDPAFRPLPQSYLKKKIWQRPVRQPTASSTKEQKTMAIFLRNLAHDEELKRRQK